MILSPKGILKIGGDDVALLVAQDCEILLACGVMGSGDGGDRKDGYSVKFCQDCPTLTPSLPHSLTPSLPHSTPLPHSLPHLNALPGLHLEKQSKPNKHK